MSKKNYLLLIILGTLLSFQFVSATETWKYNYLGEGKEVQIGANYTINVNNSEYLQGYTPTTLKTWIKSYFDGIYCLLTGCEMIGDIDMTDHSITRINSLEFEEGIKMVNLPKNEHIGGSVFGLMMTNSPNQELPHFIVQSGGDSQASVIVRSVMIQNEINNFTNTTDVTSCIHYMNAIGEELKIDCNTTTTGADLLVSDDLQVVGDMWAKDTDGEWHFMTRELELLDEMRDETVLSRLNVSIDGTNFILNESHGKDIVVNIHGQNTILDETNNSILLTDGTSTVPIFNHIYYTNGGSPSLMTSISQQEHVADVAFIMLGDGFDYGSIGGSATQYEFTRKTYFNSWYRGEVYQDGFNINVTPTEINITTGTMRLLMAPQKITSNHSTSIGIVNINATGHFNTISNLDNTGTYNDGESIGNNKYFNVVCGITNTINKEGVMYCMPQNKPLLEHSKLVDAESDDQYIAYYPNHDFIKKLYTPIVRVVMKRVGGSNEIQELSLTDGYYIDLRGASIGSGGSSPSAGITALSQLDIDTNLEMGSYNVTASNLFVADKITHTGDDDTNIEFGSNLIYLKTGDAYQLRASVGNFRIGNTDIGTSMSISGNGKTAFQYDNGNDDFEFSSPTQFIMDDIEAITVKSNVFTDSIFTIDTTNSKIAMLEGETSSTVGFSLKTKQGDSSPGDQIKMVSGKGGDSSGFSFYNGGDYHFESGRGGDSSLVSADYQRAGGGGTFYLTGGNAGDINTDTVVKNFGSAGGHIELAGGDGAGGVHSTLDADGGGGGFVTMRGGRGGSFSQATGDVSTGAGGGFSLYGGQVYDFTGSCTNFQGGQGGTLLFSAGNGGSSVFGTVSGTDNAGDGGSILFYTGSGGTNSHYVDANPGKIVFSIGFDDTAEFLSDNSGLRMYDNVATLYGSNDDTSVSWDGSDLAINTTTGNVLFYNNTGWGEIEYGNAIDHTANETTSNPLENFMPTGSSYEPCEVIRNYTDKSRPVIIETIKEVSIGINETENITVRKVTYPYTIEMKGTDATCRSADIVGALADINRNIDLYENLTDFDTGIIAENIYTQSKTIKDGKDYFEKLKDKDKLKNKKTHYSLIENVMGTELDGLSVEDRIVELEGFANQMILLLCDRNVLKKADGCP